MNCRLAHDLLQQTIDGTPVESPQWDEHLRHCADCRTLAAATRRMQEGLRLLSAPLPPPDLEGRLIERVLRDRRRSRRRARQRWAVSLALAASLFIALMLRLDWHSQAPESKDIPPESVAHNTNTLKQTPTSDAAPTLRESAAELKEVFAALTNQTADETVDQTRRLVANVPSPSLPSVDLKAMEPPARPLRQAGEGVSAGLEPVTTSARRAVGLFLREIPPMDEGQKGF
jgi:inorganic triphosphatase YgiF